MLVQPDDEVQHLPRHLKLHVQSQLPPLAEVDGGVGGGVYDGEGVAQGDQTQQFDRLGGTPFSGGAVGQGKIGLKERKIDQFWTCTFDMQMGQK